MENIKQFQDKIASAIKELDIKQIIQIINNGRSFNICCSDLDGKYIQSDKFESLMSEIKQLSETIYWFEITSVSPFNLKEKIGRLQQKGSKYKVPPTNEKNISENILYVGKVRQNFKGRILQHLGYGSPNTWSLQLMHWAKDLTPELNLTLHYIQIDKEEPETLFEKNLKNISLAILEQCVAEELKPILGKHSL